MSNDLAPSCGLDPFTWLLPGTPVDHQTRPGRPAPFTPPPLQGLHRYYEAVRPPAAHRYSAPCSSSCLEPSLTPTGLNMPIASITARGSHVPHQRLTRARATFMPDTAWPGPQAPARLIPGQDPGPRFRCRPHAFGTSAVVHSRSPSRLAPDASCAPFPQCSPPRLIHRRSLRWFRTSPCMSDPEGPTSITSAAPQPATRSPTSQPPAVLVAHRSPRPSTTPPAATTPAATRPG